MSSDLKAQLEISADASGVEAGVTRAKKSLASLGASAASEGKKASDGLANAGKGGEQAAAKIERAERNIIGSIQRRIAVEDAAGKSASAMYASLAAQRGVSVDNLKPYLDQLDAVTTKNRLAQAATTVTSGTLQKVGVSAAQTAAALRGVPAQFTDIVTSLQGGQAPLTVFLQQGGQLKDMFGGIGPAARALGGYIAGLINPFTLAAAAAGVLGFAYFQGSKEADAYAKAIILSGNATGATVGQLAQMAKAMSAVSGTQSAAAAALAEFAANGNIAANELQRFATVAVKLERETGQAVAETVKQFAELAKDPVAAAVKLNETTRFLTRSVYEQIRALEIQGRTAEAAAVAQRAYADTMDARLGQLVDRLGYLESGWRNVAGAAKAGWDAMLNVGRPETTLDQLAKVNREIEAAQGLDKNRPFRMPWDESLESLKSRQGYLQEQVRQQNKVAAAEAATAAQVKSRIDFDKEADKFLSKKVQRTRELAKANELADKAGASAKERADLIAGIEEKYKDPKAPKGTARQDSRAAALLDVEKIKAAAAELTSTYSNTEKVLEAQRSAGLVSETAYYAEKRRLLDANVKAQVDALNAENERLEKEKLNTADGLNRDRQVVENRQRIAKLTADASTAQTVLDIEAAKALTQRASALLAAKQAAEDYYSSIDRQQQRELAGYGKGQAQRNLDSGISQIEDRYSSQKRDLDNNRALLELEGKFTNEARQQYDDRLRIINEFQSKSVASYRDYFAQRQALEANASVGQSEAIADYIESSRNAASQTASMWSNGLSAAEDAWVRFATTGKLSMKDLVNSVLADFARMQARKGISGLLSALIPGAGASAPSSSSGWSAGSYDSLFSFAKGGVMSSAGALPLSKYASGGVANSPQLALFGEGRQAEAFVPLPDGRRIPVAMEGGGGGQTNHFSFEIDARGADAGVDQKIETAVRRAVQMSVGAVQSQAGRSYNYARALGGR